MDNTAVHFLDTNVFEAAKRRIRFCAENFDNIIVSCSFGKDSIAVAYLVRLVYDEMGMKDKPVEIKFMDEELISDRIVRFASKWVDDPRWKVHWIATQLNSHLFCLGRTMKYIQWDKNREWVRQKPEWAIKDIPEITSQYDTEGWASENWPGTTVMMTGIRAQESMMRLRASLRGKPFNWMKKSPFKNVSGCTPVFDWEEDDIFKLFYDLNEPYCDCYDHQLWAGDNLRVASMLTTEQSKRLDLVKSESPVMWSQLISIFPEAEIQMRYWKDVSLDQMASNYERSFDGIRKYLSENPEEHYRELEIKEVSTIERNRLKNISKGLMGVMGGYPLRRVWSAILAGSVRRGIGFTLEHQCTQKDFEFEGLEWKGKIE